MKSRGPITLYTIGLHSLKSPAEVLIASAVDDFVFLTIAMKGLEEFKRKLS